jgi:hypothetical protein
MRFAMAAMISAGVSAGACASPVIESGTYFCGPDGACLEGQACNGPDNVCVLENQVQAFDCGMMHKDVQGDDVPAGAQAVAGLGCVSIVFSSLGCLPPGDPGDWYQFDVPDTCPASVTVEARISFPVAFERIELLVSEANGEAKPAEVPCSSPSGEDAAEEIRCLKTTLVPGSHYAIGAVPDGTQDCGGTCANNRYTMQLQLK